MAAFAVIPLPAPFTPSRRLLSHDLYDCGLGIFTKCCNVLLFQMTLSWASILVSIIFSDVLGHLNEPYQAIMTMTAPTSVCQVFSLSVLSRSASDLT